jgi:hypothetical protein
VKKAEAPVEVRCERHGVFPYSKSECPGCDPERLTYRQRQDAERERLRALRQNDDVRGMLFVLERKHGVEHILGSLGQTYHGVLLGAVEIAGKRYARLHRPSLREVVCVPWVERFADWLGEKIVVEWCENEAKADHFKVSERDGAIEAPEAAKPTLRELWAVRQAKLAGAYR